MPHYTARLAVNKLVPVWAQIFNASDKEKEFWTDSEALYETDGFVFKDDLVAIKRGRKAYAW